MNKRAILLATALAVPLTVGTGLAAYGKWKEAKRQETYQVQHEKDVAAMAKKLKACPDKNRVSVTTCMDRVQRERRLTAAKISVSRGDYENAGLDYVRLGMDSDAQEMADACEKSGNTSGRDRITEALAVRADALRKAAE